MGRVHSRARDESDTTMPATLCSLWANIDYSQPNIGSHNIKIEEAYNDGVFTNFDLHLPGICVTDKEHGIGGGNVGHCFEVDARDEISLTKAMLYFYT